jgi:hypothetical protein
MLIDEKHLRLTVFDLVIRSALRRDMPTDPEVMDALESAAAQTAEEYEMDDPPDSAHLVERVVMDWVEGLTPAARAALSGHDLDSLASMVGLAISGELACIVEVEADEVASD